MKPGPFLRRLVLAASLLPLLAGCVSAVTLRNPETGATARCGPYPALRYLGPTGWNRDWSVKTDERVDRCIKAYEARGYVQLSR